MEPQEVLQHLMNTVQQACYHDMKATLTWTKLTSDMYLMTSEFSLEDVLQMTSDFTVEIETYSATDVSDTGGQL
eukprot:2911631-Amphidinium_carterae.2